MKRPCGEHSQPQAGDCQKGFLIITSSGQSECYYLTQEFLCCCGYYLSIPGTVISFLTSMDITYRKCSHKTILKMSGKIASNGTYEPRKAYLSLGAFPPNLCNPKSTNKPCIIACIVQHDIQKSITRIPALLKSQCSSMHWVGVLTRPANNRH